MNKEKRLKENYPGQTGFIPNLSGGLDLIFEIPTLIKIGTDFNLVFDGWRNDDLFEDRQDASPYLQRSFKAETSDIDAPVYDAIISNALNFLGVSEGDYKITQIEINLSELKIIVGAQHKLRKQYSSRYVETDAEFEQVKAESAEFVALLLGFAWNYGKTNDEFLRSLKRAE